MCRLAVTFFAKTNLPVIAISTIPEPTTITLNNVTPEAGFNRKRLTRIVARITAVFYHAHPLCGQVVRREEFLAAVSEHEQLIRRRNADTKQALLQNLPRP